MIYTLKHLQKLYKGFCNTPLLWSDDSIAKLPQLELKQFSPRFQKIQERRLRLGQLAEQFVFNQLETSNDFKILAKNLQIQNEKSTVGELDALIDQKGRTIHLEIVYKFFLYDDTCNNMSLKNWIGPNRKDSLVMKVEKLQKKQLPLLHSGYTEPYLKKLKLQVQQIEQQVLFKAQLFTPYGQDIKIENLNPKSGYGYYFRLHQLKDFKKAKFYIPRKIDWFLEPETQVEWMSVSNFEHRAAIFLDETRAFMFWMKTTNGMLSKGFLVWW